MRQKAFLDRTEANKAVLLLADNDMQFVLPKRCIPRDAREGDLLTLDISIDEEKTAESLREAAELQRELLHED